MLVCFLVVVLFCYEILCLLMIVFRASLGCLGLMFTTICFCCLLFVDLILLVLGCCCVFGLVGLDCQLFVLSGLVFISCWWCFCYLRELIWVVWLLV